MGKYSSIDLLNILFFEHHKEKILGFDQVDRLMTDCLVSEW